MPYEIEGKVWLASENTDTLRQVKAFGDGFIVLGLNASHAKSHRDDYHQSSGVVAFVLIDIGVIVVNSWHHAAL